MNYEVALVVAQRVWPAVNPRRTTVYPVALCRDAYGDLRPREPRFPGPTTVWPAESETEGVGRAMFSSAQITLAEYEGFWLGYYAPLDFLFVGDVSEGNR